MIYNLIKVRGFKIAAARKYMHQNRAAVDRTSEVLDTLIGVRDELKEIRNRLDRLV